jgi:hypothetical protein
VKRKIALVGTRTLALYCFVGWVYIAILALVQPYTLGMGLTHFSHYPREDTFGEACFAISFVSFFAYNMLRSAQEKE